MDIYGGIIYRILNDILSLDDKKSLEFSHGNHITYSKRDALWRSKYFELCRGSDAL